MHSQNNNLQKEKHVQGFIYQYKIHSLTKQTKNFEQNRIIPWCLKRQRILKIKVQISTLSR